ncbi:formyltransferase family protein [Thiocapsa roseopersicina]|uniref:Methionyl-tRNA formyltransferase n=1 Tax=Thiocapsa roseopersicina TaxID=1058 RepID=A0A1H2QE73_THIRO|nr:formyltransferase family protein [Thiocapsa roseopersicina]SDW05108.1 methionyl-tRNA formyltransferase [Thiocapsa roseopersicina]
MLEQLIESQVTLSLVIVIEGSHLERDFRRQSIRGIDNYLVVHNKSELLSLLRNYCFDVLISNGCPYILPVADLPPARYVNIHPSFLPDLRGVDPVIGAILYSRDAGATCHVMDSGVDTGPIISQVRIPFTDDLDVTTLYQLSFVAEKQVFVDALARRFLPLCEQAIGSDAIYYSRKSADQVISFRESNDLMLQKIKAFNNRSQGCRFDVEGVSYRVFSAHRFHNPYMRRFMELFPECVVGLSYENGIVFRKDGDVLRFSDIEAPDGQVLSVGSRLLAA